MHTALRVAIWDDHPQAARAVLSLHSRIGTHFSRLVASSRAAQRSLANLAPF